MKIINNCNHQNYLHLHINRIFRFLNYYNKVNHVNRFKKDYKYHLLVHQLIEYFYRNIYKKVSHLDFKTPFHPEIFKAPTSPKLNLLPLKGISHYH